MKRFWLIALGFLAAASMGAVPSKADSSAAEVFWANTGGPQYGTNVVTHTPCRLEVEPRTLTLYYQFAVTPDSDVDNSISPGHFRKLALKRGLINTFGTGPGCAIAGHCTPGALEIAYGKDLRIRSIEERFDGRRVGLCKF